MEELVCNQRFSEVEEHDVEEDGFSQRRAMFFQMSETVLQEYAGADDQDKKSVSLGGMGNS